MNKLAVVIPEGVQPRSFVAKFNPKFELVLDAKGNPVVEYDNHGYGYLRIRALRDVREGVKAGDEGGLIASPLTLDPKGKAWIGKTGRADAGVRIGGNALLLGEAHDNAVLRADAVVEKDACVRNDALVEGLVKAGATVSNCHVKPQGTVPEKTRVSCTKVHGELESGVLIIPEFPSRGPFFKGDDAYWEGKPPKAPKAETPKVQGAQDGISGMTRLLARIPGIDRVVANRL